MFISEGNKVSPAGFIFKEQAIAQTRDAVPSRFSFLTLLFVIVSRSTGLHAGKLTADLVILPTFPRASCLMEF